MLHRVIYASEAVGATGASTLSVAQILGVSDRNNRRDRVCACLMFHQGHILQALEGQRTDLDRLMRRIIADPRHTGLRILSDMPIQERRLQEPISLSADPAALLERIGLPCISRLSANEAEVLLDIRKAA
ncbi:BLUF domain-containing protein [Brevundimonas sp. UBA2416]|uniref:BLUF domain-containing protein n=1 Tax=Brevundimonas sp. UBA2416 TaxID=1946124 RepID=UPI0025BE9A44|nr:BLUF domain-containing protein [Brevundimonas sp. UBA2416]HRJ63950.1 BLUF domain-containing protein [Brevundimonas sp.]